MTKPPWLTRGLLTPYTQLQTALSDGLAPGRLSFEAIATHEIGHVLGFISETGFSEVIQGYPVAVSNWDLFRTAPDSYFGALPSLPRVTTFTREADFTWARNSQNLSLGLATGGDETQPGHWKSLDLTRQLIGLMDPFSYPIRQSLTVNDLIAIEAFGYSVDQTAVKNLPIITNLSVRLENNRLFCRGNVQDGDNDVRAVQFVYFDKDNLPFVNTPELPVTLNAAGGFELILPTGLGAASVVMTAIDRKGNVSPLALGDFSLAEPGGALIKDVRLSSQGLLINGGLFDARNLEVEINGQIAALPLRVQIVTPGRSILVTGTQNVLGLIPGANCIRVRSNGKWSNLFVLELPEE